MYVEIRGIVAEAQVERKKRVAELEALAGDDIETLGQPTAVGAPLPAVSAR